MEPRRIAIIGSGGAGKSTLARQLGEILGLEVYHLDALHWKPGWVETPKEQWRGVVEELVQRESWIIDGNYGATVEQRLAAADAVIFLDFPRTICLWRAIKRVIQYYGKTRPDMGPGCPERVMDIEFARWIWHYPKKSKPSVLRKIEQHCHGTLVTLRNPREVKRFLAEVGDHRSLESYICVR